MSIEDAIIDLVSAGHADADYIRRRNARMWLVTADGTSAWVAMADGSQDFEVSDTFSADASPDMIAMQREIAYALATEGLSISLEEASNRIDARAKVVSLAGKRSRKAKS